MTHKLARVGLLEDPPRRVLPVCLEVEGLVKTYTGRSILDGLDLQVKAAEFVAVLGPSGAGKTTLFLCIAGLLAPTEGCIRVLGVKATDLRREERRRIAVVFQQFNLIGRRTALGNVLAGRLGHVSVWRGISGRFSREDRLWALECLDQVGMLNHAEQRADTLSGGQQQRVAIARAIAQRPSVVLADEPVASLDPQTSQEILKLLRDICRRDGVAVVCSLHQVYLAKDYADRIIGLSQGQVVIDLDAAAFDAAASARVYGPSPTQNAQATDGTKGRARAT